MAIITSPGQEATEINYGRPDGSIVNGIDVNILKIIHEDDDTTVYVVSINVESAVEPGMYGLIIQGSDSQEYIPVPGNLIVSAEDI